MYCLGNVADQKTLAENNVLSGVVYQWDAIIANVFDDINNGTFKGRAEDDRYYWINAENDGLGIADINDPKGWLTDDDKQVIADTWSKLQSGETKTICRKIFSNQNRSHVAVQTIIPTMGDGCTARGLCVPSLKNTGTFKHRRICKWTIWQSVCRE